MPIRPMVNACLSLPAAQLQVAVVRAFPCLSCRSILSS